MKNIYGLSISDLEEYFLNIGEKKFKAIQVFEWLYQKRVTSFDEMTNIKKAVLDRLKDDFQIKRVEIVDKQSDVDVSKYLFKLKDNEFVEAVLMNHDYGNSICVSTQVGCNMGCSFCESGRRRKVRNLEVYEMVTQILEVERETKERISHVVLMGIGEPFDNYDNVIKFIDIINHDKGIAIGSRHITVSTCGIVPKIKEFTNYDKQVNLAISLHAPNNELRTSLMRITRNAPLEKLFEAIDYYTETTNRRVTYEYIMLSGENDSPEIAQQLADLIKPRNKLSYVNLIPYNPVAEHIKYERSTKDNTAKFYDVLKKNGINCVVRQEHGTDIDAACGQLRSKQIKKNKAKLA